MFYGASTAEGAGASAPGKRFSTLVCETLGWEEINLGIGGTTMTGRDDMGMIVDEESGIGRVPDVLHADPDVVVILYGANDFGVGKPLGDAQKFQQGTFFWDYDTVLRGLIENLPDARVALSTSGLPGGRRDAEYVGAGPGRLQRRGPAPRGPLRPEDGRLLGAFRRQRRQLRRN